LLLLLFLQYRCHLYRSVNGKPLFLSVILQYFHFDFKQDLSTALDILQNTLSHSVSQRHIAFGVDCNSTALLSSQAHVLSFIFTRSSHCSRFPSNSFNFWHRSFIFNSNK